MCLYIISPTYRGGRGTARWSHHLRTRKAHVDDDSIINEDLALFGQPRRESQSGNPLVAREARFLDHHRSIGPHESILLRGEYSIRLLDARTRQNPSLHHLELHLRIERNADGAGTYQVAHLGRLQRRPSPGHEVGSRLASYISLNPSGRSSTTLMTGCQTRKRFGVERGAAGEHVKSEAHDNRP